VARAKRTARADARRRYRAATDPAFDADMDESEGSLEGRGPIRRSAEQAAPARVGIFDALRVSIHPPKFREDLAILPSLLPRPALWVPVLAILVGTVIVATTGVHETTVLGLVAVLVFQNLLFPPAIFVPFIAGFLAPRASWLLGAIVGLVSAVCYSVIIVVFPLQVATATPDAATTQAAVISAFVLSPVLGAVFASAMAWYRRFLRLANPNRARPAASQKRGNDGRSRGSSGPQKAGVRR
jgi:hypothetical protein